MRLRRNFGLLLTRESRIRKDTEDEIRAHLDMRIETLMERGMSRADAEQAAMARFGEYEISRDALLAAARQRERTLTMVDRLDALRQDTGYVFRQLRRAPG